MATAATEFNTDIVRKYKVDNTILKSFFKDQSGSSIQGVVFPLRLDNRQLCSPTDYQGSKPSCCGYSAAQILESLNWIHTGKIIQLDADQIYAKAKAADGKMNDGGTYPDLAMAKGLELMSDPWWKNSFTVKSTQARLGGIDHLKRILHQNTFATINMLVGKQIYSLNSENFIYDGSGTRLGGHSLVCCGYDDQSKMLILQNHWGKSWGLSGFFLCPYSVFSIQCNLYCWYERKN